MELTNAEIRGIYDSIMFIRRQPLDFKLAYRLNKICGQLEGGYKATEKLRLELMKKYTDPTTNKPFPDRKEEFEEEFIAKLESHTRDYPNIQAIPLHMFEEGGMKANVEIISALSRIILDMEETKTEVSCN